MSNAITKIVIKKLPHGSVPVAEITDPNVRQKLSWLNENIVSLKGQIETLQRAAQELQKRSSNGGGGGGGPEFNLETQEFSVSVSVAKIVASSYQIPVSRENFVPILAICTYAGHDYLCASKCSLRNNGGDWFVDLTVNNNWGEYSTHGATYSGTAKIAVLYKQAA